MHNLGLDISSSKVGIAVLDRDNNIVVSEVLKLKSNMSLEERAARFEQRMRQIDKHYVIYNVYVEEPALMFKGGKTTAQTMAKLQRFNGMCCYILYNIFDIQERGFSLGQFFLILQYNILSFSCTFSDHIPSTQTPNTVIPAKKALL